MKHRKGKIKMIRDNCASARTIWPGQCSTGMLKALRELTTGFGFSVRSGEIKILDGSWYVTHTGLIRLANRRKCESIDVEPVPQFSEPGSNRWVFKATIRKTSHSRGFVGYGDADPSNVSPLVRGAEMRLAETRAVNRALRKAYGIGLCSVEELGWSPRPADPISPAPARIQPVAANGNGHHPGGQTRLRDQLCLLIRQYDLDPNRVKAYAAHFCGTETIKEATRELVESFISHLAASAKEDRDGLICKLNSFPIPTEVQQ